MGKRRIRDSVADGLMILGCWEWENATFLGKDFLTSTEMLMCDYWLINLLHLAITDSNTVLPLVISLEFNYLSVFFFFIVVQIAEKVIIYIKTKTFVRVPTICTAPSPVLWNRFAPEHPTDLPPPPCLFRIQCSCVCARVFIALCYGV